MKPVCFVYITPASRVGGEYSIPIPFPSRRKAERYAQACRRLGQGTRISTKQAMKLLLQHGPNPDLPFGYWDVPVDPRRTTRRVTNVDEARDIFCSWRDKNKLGGGNMCRRTGELRQDDNTLLGQFSYNGRFWPGEAHP